MLSVLFVIDALPKGGAENVLLQFADSLVDRYDVTVIALKKINEHVLPNSFKIHFLLEAEQKLIDNFFLILHFLSERAKQVDLVIGFSDFFVNYVAILAAKLVDKPVIVCVRNLLSQELSRFEFKEINRDLVSLSYNQADKILCVSEACKNDFIDTFAVGEEKVKVLRNPVNIQRFSLKVAKPRGLESIFSDSPIILAIGRLVEQKNYPFIFRVFAKIQPVAKLCIVGTGQEYEKLLEYASNLAIEKKVFFLGQRDDIPALLQHSSMLLTGSLYEGQPNVVLEAMAAGTIVVAPQLPAFSELITSGYNGVLYQADDEKDAAEQIELIFSNKDKVMNMVNNARYTVRAHDISIASNVLVECINSTICNYL
ncbi:glycosyltransferase [Methylomonas sp. YC3]